MKQENNEIDLAAVGDVVLHLHYTALDGGDQFQQGVEASASYTAATQPTQGLVLFSAKKDFTTEWQAFLMPSQAGADQVLSLPLLASRFPSRTRGKTISATSVTVYAASDIGGNFVLKPEAPLPTANVPLHPTVSGPNIALGTVALPGIGPGTWSFKLRVSTAVDWKSLTSDQIGDVLLLINYQVS